MTYPTKALGIPYVGNKWAHMNMFSAALPAGDPKLYQYLDLTFGCGVCSVFMYELGCRTFIANDASPYPRLIAKALLGNDFTPRFLGVRATNSPLRLALRHFDTCEEYNPSLLKSLPMPPVPEILYNFSKMLSL